MERASRDCVDLDRACVVLAESRAVQALIQETVGSSDYSTTIAQMRAGMLDGDLGAAIHDALIDAIVNDATVTWSGLIHGDDDDFPVTVRAYHGVYWVDALEYDAIGYFLEREAAIDFAQSNWDSVDGADT